MKTKIVKVSGKPFSSRTVIGIVCIVLAFAITFGVAPLVNRFTDRKVDIVRLKSDVGRGQIITANDIEIVNVGAHNLPSSVIKDSKTVVGKYAATDLYAGDYLLPTKLSENNKSADDVLLSLNGEKMAISVNIEVVRLGRPLSRMTRTTSATSADSSSPVPHGAMATATSVFMSAAVAGSDMAYASSSSRWLFAIS